MEGGSGLELAEPERKPRVSESPSFLSPASPVLHENQLTHTDLKPENILFVNSEFETLYNEHKVLGEKAELRSRAALPMGSES